MCAEHRSAISDPGGRETLSQWQDKSTLVLCTYWEWNPAPLKLSSLAKFMINLSTQYFIPLLVLPMLPSGLRSIKEKGGTETEQEAARPSWIQASPCPRFLFDPLLSSKQQTPAGCVCGCVVCVCATKCSQEWLSDCIIPPGQAWADAALFPLWITCLVGCWIS